MQSEYETIELEVRDYISPECTCKVEDMVNRFPHVLDSTLDPVNNILRVKVHRGMTTADDIIKELKRCAVHCDQPKPIHEKAQMEHKAMEMKKPAMHDHHAMMEGEFRRHFLVSLVFTIPVMVLSPTIQGWFGFTIPVFLGYNILLFLLASVIALYGAWPFYREAVDSLRRRMLDMMVLVSIAVGSGYLFSVASTFVFRDAVDFYWEISTLTVFLLLGHWMEMKMTRRASGAIRELVKLIPPTANLVKDSDVIEIPTSDIKVGDILLVRPGGKVPIDGVIIEGRSAIDESMITGESKPVSKKEGEEVIGGTINGLSAIRIRVDKTGEETALAQIIKLIQEVQSAKPPVQKLADRAAHYLTITAITISLGTFLYWNNIAGAGLEASLTLAVTVLVIACPHALGLAIPTVTAISITLAAKNGILVKNGEALEVGQKIDTFVFDKTGTLTQGAFSVTDIETVKDFDRNQLLVLAASLERNSEHPIGMALVRAAEEKALRLADPKGFEAIAGHGVKGVVDGKSVLTGTRRLIEHENISLSQDIIDRANKLHDEGRTLSYVAVDGGTKGVIGFADELKPSTIATIADLHKMGKQIVMITGDNKRTAEVIAKKAGVDRYLAEVLPEDKAKEVKQLQGEGKRVAMVGDGINDAPALTQADVGIAIGAGTDVAIETADVVLIKSDPADVSKLVRLSRSTMRKMKENLVWATGYNAAAIPIAAGLLFRWGIVLRPEWAALIMSVSSIIVVVNALLLRREKLQPS